jgi:hypothetical protein
MRLFPLLSAVKIQGAARRAKWAGVGQVLPGVDLGLGCHCDYSNNHEGIGLNQLEQA